MDESSIEKRLRELELKTEVAARTAKAAVECVAQLAGFVGLHVVPVRAKFIEQFEVARKSAEANGDALSEGLWRGAIELIRKNS